MGDSDSNIDTSDKETDGINKSSSDSVEAYVRNNEEPNVNAEGERRTDVSYKQCL
jgi:hypothetical protein